jgi:predicted transcriptional regulator
MPPNTDNSLITRLKEVLEERQLSIPEFEKQTGIKKDRVYKWLKRNTGRIDHADAAKINKWLSGQDLDNVPQPAKEDENNIALITARNYEKLINTNSELAKAVLEQQKIKSEVEKKILEISVSTEVLQVMLLNYHEFWIDQQHLPNSESLKRNLRKKVPLLLNKLKEANMLD